MKLIIFRHGQTDANKIRVLQGISNNPLNSTGTKQAKCLKDNLKKDNINLQIILSGPAQRAVKTAQIVADNKIDVIILKDLREVEFGPFEGQPKEEFYKEYGSIFGKINDVDNPDYWDSRIPGGESRREVAARWEKVKEYIKQSYANMNTVGISTHGGFMWVAYYTEFNKVKKFGNCEYFEVEI